MTALQKKMKYLFHIEPKMKKSEKTRKSEKEFFLCKLHECGIDFVGTVTNRPKPWRAESQKQTIFSDF